MLPHIFTETQIQRFNTQRLIITPHHSINQSTYCLPQQKQKHLNMIQNNWQHQTNLHKPSSNNSDVDEQQQLHHDIFGRSTKRPISAPPTSNEDISVSILIYTLSVNYFFPFWNYQN